MPGIGFSFGISGRSSVGPIDPAAQPLTLWMSAPFTASPWTSKPSAGSSGGIQLSEATNPPAASAGAADFDGVNDRLTNGVLSMSSFITSTAYYEAVLINVDTTQASAGTFSSEELIVGESQGGWGIAVSNSGVQGGHYNGSAFLGTPFVPIVGGWNWVEHWYDGSVFYCAVNGGPPQGTASSALGAVILSSGLPRMGANWNAAAFYDGKIREWMIMASVPPESVRTGLKLYANQTYGLTL